MLRVYFLLALFGVALAAPNGHDNDHHDDDHHDDDHHDDHDDHSDNTYAPWFQAVLAKHNISEDTYHPGFESVTLQTDTDTYVSCGEGYFVKLENLVAVIPNPESCDQVYCVDQQSCIDFTTTFATVTGLQLIVTTEDESGSDEAIDLLANLDADDEVILYVDDQFYVDFHQTTVHAGSAYPEEEEKK